MDRGEDVLADQALVEQDGVLVVVAFPGHEADQHVLAEGDLSLRTGGTVGNDLAVDDLLADLDDRALIDAGALVGAGELGELVIPDLAGLVADRDPVGGDAGDGAGALSLQADLGVDRALVLDAGGDDRGLGDHQRHGLTLHVRAHQSTVRVVVLEEGDEGGGHGDHHLRGDVDVVDLLAVDRNDLVAVAAGDTGIDQEAVLVDRLVGLSDAEVVFHVGGHVVDTVGDLGAGVLAVLVIDALELAERRFDEAVLVDLGKAGQVVDQADVRTFGRLDRAHAAVVAVVDVADVEGGALSGQATGAEGGQTALVRQLGQGVVLVHELRQRRGAEELLDDRRDRTDVDQALGRDRLQILHRHALADHALEAGEADAELVLQQLAHAAQAAVAEVVDVVGAAHTVGHADQVVDRSEDVVHRDVLGQKRVALVLNGKFPVLFGPVLFLCLLQHRAEGGEVDLFLDAHRARIEIHEAGHVGRAVGEDLEFLAVDHQNRFVDRAVGDLMGSGAGQDLAGHGQDLAGHRIDDGLCQLVAGKTRPDVHLLVELVAADLRDVVAAVVEEQGLQIGAGVVDCGGLAGTELAVDLQQAVLGRMAGVLLDRGGDEGRLAEHLEDLRVAVHAEGADQAGDRQLSVLVDADVENALRVGLIFEPCAAVRDDLRGVGVLVGLVDLVAVVHAGAADDLGDDNALGAVDDEGAAVGHEREIAHEDLLLLDLAGLLVAQAHLDLDRAGVGGVALLALLDRVLGLVVHRVVEERKLQIAGVVGDGVRVAEHLVQAFLKEPVVGVLLDLEQVGHLENLVVLGKALAEGLAEIRVLNQCHWGSSLPF